MYARFTDRARKVMDAANEEALSHGHETIDTPHILLGLLAISGARALAVLSDLNVDFNRLRTETEKLLAGRSQAESNGRLPQTREARKIMEYTSDAARQLHHNFIGTEHVLLGLLHDAETETAKVLTSAGVAEQAAYDTTQRLPR